MLFTIFAIACFATAGLVALGVVRSSRSALFCPEHLSVRLIDDLDVDRELQMPPRGHRLLRDWR